MTTAIYTGRTHEGLSPLETPTLHRGEKGLCPAPECRAARIPALALTVQRPWADAIAFGGKTTENRVWPIPEKHLGATVMIHAGKEEDKNAQVVRMGNWRDQRGVILAVARLTSCHQATTRGPLCCAPWGFPPAHGKSMWHWQLDDVQALPMPIQASGAQKLWRPQASLIEAVRAQQEGTLS